MVVAEALLEIKRLMVEVVWVKVLLDGTTRFITLVEAVAEEEVSVVVKVVVVMEPYQGSGGTCFGNKGGAAEVLLVTTGLSGRWCGW